VDAAPHDANEWLFEIKFDGYRLLTRVERGAIRLYTRNGHDWTGKLTALADELKKMDFPDGWYDGEIVVLNDAGKPDFGALQLSFDEFNTAHISYFLFDLPYCAGQDLREVPLIERRKVLARVVQRHPSSVVQLSAIFDYAPGELVTAACRMGLEGVIGKRRHSRYVSRRSDDWIKLKCSQRQEFVIGGYTDPQGKRTGIGSLLLGVHDAAGNLRYAGNVGTGFNEKTLRELKRKLDDIQSDRSPFVCSTDDSDSLPKAHFVKPMLLAEVSFGEWTRTGHIRHSVFHGLRGDKPASAIVREQAVHVSSKPAGASETSLASLHITHPERVIDAASGTTKLDLIRYYSLVAPLMMPHLADRLLALVRAPAGVGGELFFQKHVERSIAGIRQMDLAQLPTHPGMLVVENAEGLLQAARWNTVELHTMNATSTHFDAPDRMIFDLDPGEGVQWKSLQEAAVLVRAFLNELGLQAFLKTSGGKGLHLVVPIESIQTRFDWGTVKAFSEAIVVHLKQTIPERFVAKSGPRNRVGKIFVDYLRNGLGSTTVCAWSVRARPGMGISVPVAWDELPHLKASDQWTVKNVHERLDVGNNPWSEWDKSGSDLAPAMQALGFTPHIG
jgi:bifunctional non-homologous end joining protein LigD